MLPYLRLNCSVDHLMDSKLNVEKYNNTKVLIQTLDECDNYYFYLQKLMLIIGLYVH